MFGFVKRLFGAAKPATINSDPFGRDVPLPSATRSDTPVIPAKKIPPVVLQRDEIIDTKTRIAGYRFSARRPDTSQQPDPLATLDILVANNVAAFAERRLALILLSKDDWTNHNYQPLINSHTAFLLSLPETPEEIDTWRETADAIRCAGAKIALSGSAVVTYRKLISEYADLLLLDIPSYSLSNLEQLLRTLRREQPNLQLIAENVSRWPEHRYCVSHGFAYCLGPFTTEQDEEEKTEEIGESRLVLIEMLNQLRKEADLTEIAETAKRDPGVVVKVVAMANSPMLGFSQSVTSIDQAIMVLGRAQLYRWLSIGMFRAGTSSPRDEVLLELALARGRFLEVLGQEKHTKLECDELFLLGLLSLLDSLLGLPMSTVLGKINLSPVLKEVLLTSSGPLGRNLLLAIAVEKGHVQNVVRLTEQLGYSLEAVQSASIEAIGWAEEAVNLSS